MLVIGSVFVPLIALLAFGNGQRLGNACWESETNHFLSMVDCTSFIRCQDGVSLLERCPPATFFNPLSHECDMKSFDECLEISNPNRLRLLRPSRHFQQALRTESVERFHIDEVMASDGDSNRRIKARNTTNKNGLMVCYYTNWAQYRPGGGKFTPEDIDPSLCDHLHYAFAKLNPNHTIAAYEWNDESTSWMTGMYARFNQLKKKNPGLKTMLSLGGWNMASEPFSCMAATRNSRKVFIDSVVAFLRKWCFDGLSIDWEYPSSRGGAPGDKESFTLLVQELVSAFEEESRVTGEARLMLSAAVSAGKDTIDSAYEVEKIARALDYIVLMTYDFFGAWESSTGLVSPLYPPRGATGLDAIFNVQYASNYWVKKGCPINKLVIGVISYGRSFTLTNPANDGLKAPTNGPGTPGQFTREAGFLSYYEVCSMVQKGAKVVRLKDEKVPYLVCENQWVSYEDQESLEIKAKFIRDGGFAGAAMWSVPLDDFKGTECKQGPYPLLSRFSMTLKNIQRSNVL